MFSFSQSVGILGIEELEPKWDVDASGARFELGDSRAVEKPEGNP